LRGVQASYPFFRLVIARAEGSRNDEDAYPLLSIFKTASQVEDKEKLLAEMDFERPLCIAAKAQDDGLSGQGFGETDFTPLEADPAALLYLAHVDSMDGNARGRLRSADRRSRCSTAPSALGKRLVLSLE
jgi:hypothetical protein